MSYYGEEDWECPKCGGEIFMNKELTGATDFYYEWNCRKCRWAGLDAKKHHFDDYGKCDCKGLEEHARVMKPSRPRGVFNDPFA